MGKIIGLARNYAKHAAEMGSSPTSGEPVFFLKPTTSVVGDGGTVWIPPGVERVEHEIELAVVIARNAKDVAEDRWKDFVLGYGVVLDMTARSLQDDAKKRGEPWALSKSFDSFCPISTIADKSRVQDPQALDLQLFVNGEMRQRGNTREMVLPIGKVITYLSSVMTLERGDVIATGTPEGVGPVKRGDKLEARIPGLVSLTVKVDQKQPRR